MGRLLGVLCWDIDGTLLSTGRAGIGAWEQATGEIGGRVVELTGLRTAGLTDVEVGEAILSREGLDKSTEALGRLILRYEELLPERLEDRAGYVCPGVRELLEFNHQCGWAPCILLTGNTSVGARAKLRHYALESFFHEGAFASLEAPDRISIARHAQGIVRRMLGAAYAADRMVVIGDTPHDVAAGNAIGARTVAVASGDCSLEQLRGSAPWRVLQAIPQPADFVALLDGRAGAQ